MSAFVSRALPGMTSEQIAKAWVPDATPGLLLEVTCFPFGGPDLWEPQLAAFAADPEGYTTRMYAEMDAAMATRREVLE